MRIAQVAPLTEAVPPKLYGGTERVVHWLTEGQAPEVPPRWAAVSSMERKLLQLICAVTDVQAGTRRVYSLDPKGLDELRDYLERFWRTALHSFKTRVERENRDKEQGESDD